MPSGPLQSQHYQTRMADQTVRTEEAPGEMELCRCQQMFTAQIRNTNNNKQCTCKSNMLELLLIRLGMWPAVVDDDVSMCATNLFRWSWRACTDADLFTLAQTTLPFSKVGTSAAVACSAA